MSRPSTGTVKWRPNPKRPGTSCWQARYSRSDKSRTPWHVLDEAITQDDEAGARAFAAEFASLAKATTKDGTGESVSAYSIRWLTARPARTRKDNRSHLDTHILPEIGNVAILSLTAAHGDRLVGALDRKIADGTMSDKTARNVWGTVKRMLRDAAHAKPATGLRCLEANPFRDVMPPERTRVKKSLQWLYPSELVSFVSHPDVPLRWKRNVAIAVYLGLRDGEQRALRWPQVDLEHGIVRVSETFDRETKAAREGTKTGAVRTVPIPAPLMPLLTQMHEESGGEGLVCKGVYSQRAMARGLRTWLRKAGVTRPELHARTSVSLPIRWHDLRATYATWLAVTGAAATEIRDVLGHTQVSMTDRYMRAATVARAGNFGAPFPALPSDTTQTMSLSGAVSIELLTAISGVDGTTSDSREAPETPCLQADRSITVASDSSPLATSRDVPQRAPTFRIVASDERAADLRTAIDRITHVLSNASDEAIPGLVSERACMRAELAAIERVDAGVIDLFAARRKSND